MLRGLNLCINKYEKNINKSNILKRMLSNLHNINDLRLKNDEIKIEVEKYEDKIISYKFDIKVLEDLINYSEYITVKKLLIQIKKSIFDYKKIKVINNLQNKLRREYIYINKKNEELRKKKMKLNKYYEKLNNLKKRKKKLDKMLKDKEDWV